MSQTKNLKKSEIVAEIAEMWAPLSDKQISDLSKNLTIKQYKKGELIYSDHGTPTTMMYIISGKAKIYKDGVTAGSRRQILRIVKPKEFFDPELQSLQTNQQYLPLPHQMMIY